MSLDNIKALVEELERAIYRYTSAVKKLHLAIKKLAKGGDVQDLEERIQSLVSTSRWVEKLLEKTLSVDLEGLDSDTSERFNLLSFFVSEAGASYEAEIWELLRRVATKRGVALHIDIDEQIGRAKRLHELAKRIVERTKLCI